MGTLRTRKSVSALCDEGGWFWWWVIGGLSRSWESWLGPGWSPARGRCH